MAAEAAAAQRAEKILQRFESKKIDRFIGNFKAGFELPIARLAELAARGSVRRRSDLRRLLRIDETFVSQTLGEFVEEIFNRLAVHGVRISKHFAKLFAHGVFGNQVALLQGAQC